MNEITVCIVEDQETLLYALETLVNSAPGLSCTGCFINGKLAAENIPVLQPDIVLMDLVMPVMGGIEAIRRIKPLCPATQFMAVTIHDEDAMVFDALKAGATAYLLKRSSYDELTGSIRELYNGGSPMSSDIARKIVSSFHEPIPTAGLAKSITRREKEILELMSRGFNYKEVAEQLFISSKTVRKHIYNIYEKLHVNSKIEAVNKFFGRPRH